MTSAIQEGQRSQEAVSVDESARYDHVVERTTTTRVVVRSTDVDTDGYVNNAVYHQYCEQGRLDHLRRLGVVGEPDADRRLARFTIAENRCRFLAPVYYGDAVTVRTSTVRVGRSSFVLAYTLVREDDDVVVAEAESVQVWLGDDGAATPVPDPARAALTATIVS